MCGSVYGSVVVDRKYARMYVLARGRIAVELSNAGDLVDLSVLVQGRSGLPYSRVKDLDIHDVLALRITDDELRPPPPHRFRHMVLGDQYEDPEPEPEAKSPGEEWSQRRVNADLAGVQTLVDFMAAGVTRLGAVNADAPVKERLPTPIQDRWDADIEECLMLKGLPPELALSIRQQSVSPDNLAKYLDFTAEEQERRPKSKGLWRRMLRHSQAGFDPHWHSSPDDGGSSSEEDGTVTEEESGTEGDTGTEEGSGVEESASEAGGGEEEQPPHAPDEGTETGVAAVGEDTSDTASHADDEAGDSDEEADGDGHDSDTSSVLSERTRQWITETGSVNSNPQFSDWRVFDVNDLHDVDSDVGYSSWSAEHDYYEEYHILDNDTRFVLSITEQVLEELCRIVPVTKEEMDELVQAQYKLDLERYKQ